MPQRLIPPPEGKHHYRLAFTVEVDNADPSTVEDVERMMIMLRGLLTTPKFRVIASSAERNPPLPPDREKIEDDVTKTWPKENR